MSASPFTEEIRRILVAVDASPHSLAALEAAAEMAARLQAELLGLFVEDVNLLRSADLPITREVCSLSATTLPMDSRHVERELRAQAEQARRALASVASRRRVRWSFRVTRGSVTEELLRAASEADLVTVGKSGWTPTWPRGLGGTARAVLHRGTTPLLIAGRGAEPRPPIYVVYDGSDASRRALRIAFRLARGQEKELRILAIAREEADARALQTDLSDLAGQASVETISGGEVGLVNAVAHAVRDGMLVLPVDGRALTGEAVISLLTALNRPALLVR
ncbi:MAG: universal stress protein [Anaerolineae bacterium]